MRKWVAGLVGAVLVILLATFYFKAIREKRIAEANERAALDTTRIHLVGELRAASLLVQQEDIKLQELQGALEAGLRDRRAVAKVVQGMRVIIDSLSREHQRPDSETRVDGTRIAMFNQQGPPIEGRQVVTVTPNTIDLSSQLRVTPFSIRYGLGCDNHHTAVAVFETPNWVRTEFQRGRVDPGVCNPKNWTLGVSVLTPSLGKVLYLLFGLGIGRVLK